MTRKAVRGSHKKWVRTGSEEDRHKYVDARHAMKLLVREAKVKSWQTYCSDANSPKELARINKILKRNINRTMGLLRRRDGAIATSPEESVDILLDEHFPGSVRQDDLEHEEAENTPQSQENY